jgi:hypothetical protein
VKNVKHFGGLTLGYSLISSVAIHVEPLSAFDTIPPLVALSLATLYAMYYNAHNYFLPKPMPYEKWITKDGEIATEFQVLSA